MGFLNIQAADKPTTAPPTGLALADDTGGLKYLGATLDLSSNPIVLGGYAQLQKIGLYVAPGTAPGPGVRRRRQRRDRHPGGDPIVNVDGCAAFALFEAGESGTVCDVHYANLPYDDTIVRVSGTVGIVPLGQVGSGFVQYQSFGQELSFAGKLDDYDVLGLGLFVVSADATGKMNFEPSFSFQTSSHGTLSIADAADLGGEFVLSSRGMAGCLDLLTGHVGASYPYGGGLSLFGDFDDGCDLTTVGGVTLRRRALPRATDLIAGRGAQAGLGGLPARTVTVKGSPPFVMLGATGQSGSPQVTVTGPKGERIDDDGSPMQKRGGTAIIHSTKLGRTWVYVERPSAGTWSIEPQAGSTPLTAVSLRNGLPEPRVLAKVRRSGRRYTLAYHVTRLPGQEVTFAEGSRVLGRARSADGKLRFAAGPGPGGRRRIVAHVVQGGTPRADMTVASYTAPPPPRIGKPRPRARVRGTTLTVKWGRTANAARYRVRFEASDGRVQTFETSAPRRAVVVRRFLRTTSARVTVTAVGADGRTGSPATVRVRRRGRAPAIVPTALALTPWPSRRSPRSGTSASRTTARRSGGRSSTRASTHDRRAPQPPSHMLVALALTRGRQYTFPVLAARRRAHRRLVGDHRRARAPPSRPAALPGRPGRPRAGARARGVLRRGARAAHAPARVARDHARSPTRSIASRRQVSMPALAKLPGAPAAVRTFVNVRYSVQKQPTRRRRRASGSSPRSTASRPSSTAATTSSGDAFSVADLTAASLFYPLVQPAGGADACRRCPTRWSASARR